MERAVVLEIEDDKMVLLTENGRFVSRQITFPCPEIGAEIELSPPPKNILGQFKYIFAAAAVLIFAFFLTRFYGQTVVTPSVGTIVSYVTVDINPSVELGLDLEDNVVTVEALNKDAEIVLQGMELVGKPSSLAVESIVEAAISKGYLAPEKANNVLINVSGKNPADEKIVEMAQELPQKADQALKKNRLEAQVDCIKTDLELRECARELGVSAGKYAVLLEAQEAGIDVSPQDIKTMGIAKAVKAAGGNPDQVISKAREEKDFSGKVKAWKNLIKEKAEKSLKQNKSSSLKDGSDSDEPPYQPENHEKSEKRDELPGKTPSKPDKMKKGDPQEGKEHRFDLETGENRKKTKDEEGWVKDKDPVRDSERDSPLPEKKRKPFAPKLPGKRISGHG